MSKTILFFPSDIGLAHLVRTYAIAEQIHRAGHRAVIAVPERKRQLFEIPFAEIVPISPMGDEDHPRAYRIFHDARIVDRMIQEEREICERVKPDACVVDLRLTATVSAALHQIPTFFVINSTGLPSHCHLPSFGLNRMVARGLYHGAHLIADRAKYSLYQELARSLTRQSSSFTIQDIMKRVVYLVPEPSWYLPVRQNYFDIRHVGPLFWDSLEREMPPGLDAFLHAEKSVYLSFGGTGFDTDRFIRVSHGLAERGYHVVVSTGTLADPSLIPPHPFVYTARFVPGSAVCRRVHVMVCHGGHGTFSQALAAGIPIVSIPFNPDQYVHAFRLTELECGENAVPFSLRDLWHMLHVDTFDRMEDTTRGVSNERILASVDRVYQQYSRFTLRIRNLMRGWDTNGAVRAAEIITSTSG